jgi:hypothetical protein
MPERAGQPAVGLGAIPERGRLAYVALRRPKARLSSSAPLAGRPDSRGRGFAPSDWCAD